jgi:MFS family permease
VRQPAVLWLTALTFLATFVGYGQIEAGLPAFARTVSEVSTRVIGFGFAVNTATIVLLQFVVLRRISGHRTLLQPTIPAITNDLAPDHLRGRYNAVSAGAFQGGTILGPVVAGFMLNHGWSWAFVSMIVVGCALMAVLALVLEKLITPVVNGIAAGDTTPMTDPVTGEPVITD